MSASAILLLIPVGIVFVSMTIDSRGLPDSIKAMPPALLEHLQETGQARSNPTRYAEAGPGPLSVAVDPFADADLKRAFEDAFYRKIPDSRQSVNRPVDKTMADFLDSRRGLLERFYAWAQAGGRLAPVDSANGDRLMPMAVADAERSWRNDRPQETLQIAKALFRLIESIDRHDPKMINALRWDSLRLCQMVQDWIENGPLTVDIAQALQRSLDRMGESQVDRIKSGQYCWEAYAFSRKNVVQALEESWHSPVFGFDPSRAELITTVFGVNLPNPSRIAAMTLDAIRAKRRAPKILSEWDDWYQGSIERAAATTLTESRERLPDSLPDFLQSQAGPYEEKHMELLVLLRCNLDRAGLVVLRDPSARPPASIDIANDPLNPWRDPYTDAPLRLIERNGRIAIFSSSAIGGNANEDALSLENNDNVLFLPASSAPIGETGR